MNPKDFELKEVILDNGLDREYDKAHLKAFQGDSSALECFRSTYGAELSRVASNVTKSQYRKYKRVRERTTDIVISSQAVFLTLTFSPKTLSNTSEATRRKYVRRYLKSQSPEYVANIDYGNKNEREHYHAVVYSPNQKIDLAPWRKYGFIFADKVRTKQASEKRLAKYITKLTRHALKKSTHDGTLTPRLIYARHKKGEPSFLEDLLPF